MYTPAGELPHAASETPGSPVWRMNPRSRSGRNFTSINSSTTRSHNSSLSLAARLASRPYFAHPQTPSSGFRLGTYPGKVLGHHGGVLRQPRLDHLRLAVDLVPVPHHRHRPEPSV